MTDSIRSDDIYDLIREYFKCHDEVEDMLTGRPCTKEEHSAAVDKLVAVEKEIRDML